MKKRWILYILVLLTIVFFSVSQVLASPVDISVAKKTPGKTPGAQATQRAVEKANADDESNNDNNGNGKAKGKGEENGNSNGNTHGKPINIKGILVSIGEDSLEIKISDDSTITVIITDETRIHIPTLGKDATLENLVEGVQLGVQAREDDEGSLIALKVTVIPGRPTKVHRVGTVTEYEEGVSITIQAKDGEFYTFLLTENTKILPASRADDLGVGARVTIIAPRDVTGVELTATGIVVHPKGMSPTEEPTEEPTEVPTEEPTEESTEAPPA